MNRLSVGVDVSKETLDVAYWENDEAVYIGQYPNNQEGFQEIEGRIQKQCEEAKATTVHIVMEPTGGYEQPFAHFADQRQDWRVSLPNPLRVREWFKAMGKRARTEDESICHEELVGMVSSYDPDNDCSFVSGHLAAGFGRASASFDSATGSDVAGSSIAATSV